MVDMGNELSIANAVAAEEEQRILRELSEALTASSGALARDLEALAALDVLEASAILAADLDAHAPEVTAPSAGFELLSLRHPILVLQQKKVVASHVSLAAPARALIVSGPNGGGKTVAITAVGLSALMLRAGLPVPAAEGSRLPFFLEVKAAVDERGDLAKDLSTFTAHLAAVKDMLEGAIPGSLVLVDEIAADTDPREGAALAAAILDDLVERGAAVLVTTHLDELKALALTDRRFANARVGFDAEKLRPTYQLHLGTPGSSSAIEVAGRHFNQMWATMFAGLLFAIGFSTLMYWLVERWFEKLRRRLHANQRVDSSRKATPSTVVFQAQTESPGVKGG